MVIFAPFLLKVYSNVKVNEELKLFHLKLIDSIKGTTISLTCQSWIQNSFWQDRTLKNPLKQLGSFLHFWHLSPILWNSFKKSCNFIDGFNKMDHYISNLSILVLGFYLGRQNFEKTIKGIGFISTFLAFESNFM